MAKRSGATPVGLARNQTRGTYQKSALDDVTKAARRSCLTRGTPLPKGLKEVLGELPAAGCY